MEFERLIRRLKLNRVSSYTSAYGALLDIKRLGEALKTNESLRYLDLGFNGLTKEDCFHLANALNAGQSHTLCTLLLRGNNIRDGGVDLLSEALKFNSGLVVLDLQSNQIGFEGSEKLAEALKVNNCLKELNLASNFLNDTGAAYLAGALKVNKSLTKLDLFENSIGDPGARYLSRGLRENETLTELSLQANNIQDGGAIHLARTLARVKGVLSCLRVLNLSFTRISDVGALHLAEALNKNHTIIDLNVSENDIDQALESQIDAEIRLNRMQIRQKEKNTFHKVLNGADEMSWNRSKLIFVGHDRVGKSATCRSLVGKPFREEWHSTIGAEVTETEITPGEDGSTWDAPNDLDDTGFASMFAAKIMVQNRLSKTLSTRSSKKYKPVIAKVRDSVKRSSIKLNNAIRKSIRNSVRRIDHSRGMHLRIQRDTPHMNSQERIDSKSSINSKSQSVDSGEDRDSTKLDIIRQFNANLILDAVDSDRVSLSIWDLAGQEVFYTMHSIFLTANGVYLLVFDMRELVGEAEGKEKAMGYISFWLQSIRLHSPTSSVLLVGTFCFQLEEEDSLTVIDTCLREFCGTKFAPQIVLNQEENLMYFPIDNQYGYGIDRLRMCVEKTVRADPSIQEKVSIKWMVLLDEILADKNEGGADYISLQEIRDKAKSIGIESSLEVEEALHFFNERGMLIFLTATEVLKQKIILNPKWLIDSFAKVIRDDSIHSYDMQEIAKSGLESDLRLLFDKGVASRDFLEHIWGDEHINFLLNLMERTFLMCDWNFSDRKQDHFLVPTLLKDKSMGQLSGSRCVFDFSSSFLPAGFFQSLLALCVSHSASYRKETSHENICNEPKLFKTSGTIEFQPGSPVHLKEDIGSQEIVLYVENKEAAEKVLSIAQSMLRKLNNDLMRSGISWEIYLQDDTSNRIGNDEHRLVSYDEALERRVYPWFKAKDEETQTSVETSHQSGFENVDFESFIESLHHM